MGQGAALKCLLSDAAGIILIVSQAVPSLHNSLELRRTTESDWPELRTFRLENAREHPISYGATFAQTSDFDEEAWRMRARRGDQRDQASYVVIERLTGRWIGMMACQIGDEHGTDPVLTGVYVLPEFRGSAYGVADTLLGHIVSWAQLRADQLRLWVYEGSEPARRFYRRHGFRNTGRVRATDLPRGGTMLEMSVSLTSDPCAVPAESDERPTCKQASS